MNNEYTIINKTLIQKKRVEELEKYSSNTDFEEERRLTL